MSPLKKSASFDSSSPALYSRPRRSRFVSASSAKIAPREGKVTKNARDQDVRLILQLAEMYRDPDMQSARAWWHNTFWPESARDYLKVEAALGTPENLWLGQVISYWGMAAALVAQGTLGEQALLGADFSNELFEVFCKVQPFLEELRRRAHKPGLLRNIEALAMGSTKNCRRVAAVLKRSASSRKEMSRRLAKAS